MKQLSPEFMNGCLYMASIAAQIVKNQRHAEPTDVADWIMDAETRIQDIYENQPIDIYEETLGLEKERIISHPTPIVKTHRE